MGPYLAVIKDSFREAMASRILWILLLAITFVLIAVAPFSFSEKTTTRLGDDDFVNFTDFVIRVQAAAEIEEKTPARRISDMLDDGHRESLKRFKPGQGGDGFEVVGIVRRFLRRLNELIEDESFYEPEYFANTRMLTDEGRDLRKRVDDGEELSALESARFNRLLMEAAFPDVVRSGLPTSLQFRYISYELGPAFPISRKDFNQMATDWAAFIMKWFVGVVGVVIAILVTASVIPQMFDPGSLHLLLSNPVSRSLLFLSKFLGGCAFTFLSAAYLVGGLWLLLGVRFGIWQLNLLYSIPLYVFVFAIYYAVSALAGVVWRNPLICIAISVIFWLVCLSMGYIKYGYENFALQKTKFTRLIEAGDTLVGVNETGIVRMWSEDKEDWDEILVSENQRAMQLVVSMMPETPAEFLPLGPVYDSENDRMINVIRDMQRGARLVTLVGSEETDWKPKEGASPPSGMIQLMHEPDGGMLAVSSYGLYRLEGDPLEKQEGRSLFGVVPLPNMSTGPFKPVGPSPAVILTRPYAVALDPTNGDLATYSRSEITLLAKDEKGKFQIANTFKIDNEPSKPVVMATTGGNVIIGRADGAILLYDIQSGKLMKQFEPESRGTAKWLSPSPDGDTFAVAFNNGNLWVLNASEQSIRKPRVRGQGDVSAVHFTTERNLLVTHQSVRVNECSLDSNETLRSFAPSMGALEVAYRYVIYPLYVAFPKPSELDRTIEYTLASEEEANKIEKPFEPLWSSLLFIIVVLALSCLYVERQEF